MAGKYSDAVLGGPAKSGPRKYADRVLSGAQKTPQAPQYQPSALEQRTQEVTGMQPNIDRPMLLPQPDAKEGGGVDMGSWTAPGWAYDLAQSVVLPRHAMKGGEYTGTDVARFGMGALMPVTAAPGAVLPKTVQRTGLTRAQVKSAPTTQQLKSAAKPFYDKASSATARIKPDSYVSSMAKLEQDLIDSGFDPDVHKKSASVLKALSKRVGSELDMVDMQNIRKIAGSAANDLDPNEARIGSKIVSHIDDYVNRLSLDDLASGTTGDAGKNLTEARKLWSQMAKSRDIDNVFEAAKDQASGYENGLRIGFRSLLKKKSTEKRFSKDEIAAMRDVVAGNFTRNTLKRLGKLGPGTGQQTNTLGMGMGGSVGAGIGAAVGGIPGAIIGATVAPAASYGAQKLGERGTTRAAELARALAAGVRPEMRATTQAPGFAQRLMMGQAASGMLPQGGRLSNELQRPARGNPLGDMTDEQIRRFLAQGGT